MHTIKESIAIKEDNDEYQLYPALLYQGMIIRDAPDSVLRKHGIPLAKRYPEAIKSLQRAVDYFTAFNSPYFMPPAYKELSIAYDSIKDYKRFHDVYKKYIALRDSSVNRTNQNAFISKLADIQFEKKEDSLKFRQRLTSDKLPAANPGFRSTKEVLSQRYYCPAGPFLLYRPQLLQPAPLQSIAKCSQYPDHKGKATLRYLVTQHSAG